LAINFVFPQGSKNKRSIMLNKHDRKVIKELVELALDTRTSIESDDTPFATLSSIQAKLTQMEIEDDQANKLRRSNKK